MKSLHTNLILISCVLFLAAGLADADNILLGRPTDNSITASVITDLSGEISFEYGTVSGFYGNQTAAVSCTAGVPVKQVISGLTPNTKYYYRQLFRTASGNPWTAGSEYSFHTQRNLNSTFKFTVISDSHLGMMGDANRYNQTTLNVAADNPDFHLDLGDAFIMNSATTQSAANTVYANQRPYFGNFSHSAAVFLVIGNHENEEGWNFDDTPSKALLSINARKQYYLNPIPDAFYSGNTDNSLTAISGDHLREDYYAWEWGDALFVVLDPFQYTMNLPYTPVAGEDNDEIVSGDQWNWTLGQQQFNWFKQTLENSSATYKFVFSHHVTGGQLTVSAGAGGPGYVRGGANAAPYFEWGGLNANDTWGFNAKRPGWGDDPIHQLMIDNGVSAFFHGHDHQYAYEKIDGIVYQSVPSPSMTGSGFGLYSESDPYTIKVLDNSGHLRITVSPSQATVDYVGTSTGAVNYSYNIEPAYTGAFYDLTISANPSGSSTTTPAAGVHSYQENEIVNITAAANPGYVFDYWEGDVANPNSASTTVTMDADKTVIAYFEESATSEVTLDGTVSSGTANSVSSINIAHTTGTGTNRLMLLGVSWNCGTTARTISSVTFTPNGGSAVSLTNVITEQTGTQLRYSAIYRLLNPPSGTTGTVTVTFSGSVSNGIVVGAANFAGVNQTTPLGTPNGTNGNSTSPSAILTGLNGNEMVFDNVFQGAASSSQTLTAGAGQTEQWNEWISNTRAAASTEQAAGSSVTISWTAASSTFWAIVAVPINPAPPLVTHDLTMSVSPTGSGTTTPPVGVHTYTKNTVVDIIATPAEGYVFHHWQGNVADPNSASTTVTIDANKTVTAHFVELPIKYIGNIGTATSKTAGTSLNITTTQSAAAGDAIIIAYATDPNQTLEISVSDSAGNTYQQAAMAINYGYGRTYIFAAYNINALPSGSTITITGNHPVVAKTAVVSVFRGLDVNPLDQSLGYPLTTSVSGTTPSSGATETTAQADELLIGAIGTEGPVEDNAGNWDYSFIAGPRAGTTGGTGDTNWTVSLGYRFVSATGQYTAQKSGVTSRRWAAAIATFRAQTPSVPKAIFGYITEPDVNVPIEGIYISANNGGSSDTTDSNGFYQLIVPSGWSGDVEPNKIGYTFEPNIINYSNVITDQNDNYIALLDTFLISGYVLDLELSEPLEGVLLTPDNDGGPFTSKYYGGADITDANGYYEVMVDYNFSGKITPSQYAYAFEPNSIDYNDVTADIEDQNYVGTLLTYTIAGYVKNECGVPIADVILNADNGGGSDITDANGFYEVWVDYNWFGTVTPSKENYTFEPNSLAYVDVLDDITDQNYVAANIYDLDSNCIIGVGDLEILCGNWLMTGENIPGDFYKDENDIVNFLDFALFANQWLN